MGGAQRAERRRKRQEAGTGSGGAGGSGAGKGATAAASNGPSRTLLAVVVVVVLAAIVAGGLIWQRVRSDPGAPEAERVAEQYQVRLDGGVVIAGDDNAEVAVDIYEDFLCPACASVEQRDGPEIRAAIERGEIQVRYHVVNILDERSNPAGYSTAAGNATLCAAEAGEFASYHASLLGKPPREGGRGYTADQFVQLGAELGITDAAFESCVRDGTHEQAVHDNERAAAADPALQRTFANGSRGFGTPTIVVDGEIVDITDESWLTDATSP